MLKELRKFIDENELIKPGDRILLGVSGGIDSMVMTHLFLQLENEIAIAHCNFTLRGNESDKDEDMVRRFAAEHNIRFYSTRFETKKFAKKNVISVQMAARELRYKWFEEIRKENRYDIISVAHNLNDNVETLIINLTRGTGIAGMTGMRPSINRIIRPLLFATRKDITDYRNINQIIFREDKSNSDTKYIRNKIRHMVIPVLKEINPSIEITLNETAERFNGINEILTEYISGLRKSISVQKENYLIFNISLLKTHLHNKAVIYELFKPYSVTNAIVKDLIAVIEGKTGGHILTDTYRIIKNREEILVTSQKSGEENIFCVENITELQKVPVIFSAGYVDITSSFQIQPNPSLAYIDADKIKFPVIIRKWKPGDYFYPFGMKQRKKLSDYFTDNKYSVIDKENISILESDGKIVWIIGDRIDNRFRITRSTTKALLIKSPE